MYPLWWVDDTEREKSPGSQSTTVKTGFLLLVFFFFFTLLALNCVVAAFRPGPPVVSPLPLRGMRKALTFIF